jgi:hypothetical protein
MSGSAAALGLVYMVLYAQKYIESLKIDSVLEQAVSNTFREILDSINIDRGRPAAIPLLSLAL